MSWVNVITAGVKFFQNQKKPKTSPAKFKDSLVSLEEMEDQSRISMEKLDKISSKDIGLEQYYQNIQNILEQYNVSKDDTGINELLKSFRP